MKLALKDLVSTKMTLNTSILKTIPKLIRNKLKKAKNNIFYV